MRYRFFILFKTSIIILLILVLASCTSIYTRTPDLRGEAWVDNYVRIELVPYDLHGLVLRSELQLASIRTYERVFLERFVRGAWRTAPWQGSESGMRHDAAWNLPAYIRNPGHRGFIVGMFGYSGYEPTSGGLYRIRLPITVYLEDRYFTHDLVYEFYWP